MKTFTPSFLRCNIVSHLILTTLTMGMYLIVMLPYWFLFKQSQKLIIGDTDVVYRTGILSKKTREIHVDDVRSIKVNQGSINRLMGIGDIEISSSSGIDDQIIVRGISNPNKIRQLLKEGRNR